MSQRYPDKHWSRNFDPAHLRNHVGWLLGDSVAQLKAVPATWRESVSPAWPVVLRIELELRKEAMRMMNMHSVTIAEAFSAARRSDELRTRYLIAPLALGGSQRPQQEPRSDVCSTDKTKSKPQSSQSQPKAGNKRTRRGSNARENKRCRCRKCEHTLWQGPRTREKIASSPVG